MESATNMPPPPPSHTTHLLRIGSRDNPGIIPLAVQEIMDTIAETPQRAFLIRCSYLEIYNEQITDLLADSKETEKVDIHESKARVRGERRGRNTWRQVGRHSTLRS